MKKIFIVFLVLMIAGCVTPKKVESDYKAAQKNDERAQEARERGSFEEAEHYEKMAERQREHKGFNVAIGYIFSSIFSSSKSENN